MEINEYREGELTYDTLPSEIRNAIDNNQTVGVAYVKKDGSVRHMAFRRYLNAYQHSTKEKSVKQLMAPIVHNQMRVYDTNLYIKNLRGMGDPKKAAGSSYRIITLHEVLGFFHGGKFYDMREKNNIREKYGNNIYSQITKNMLNALNSEIKNTDININEAFKFLSKQKLFEVVTKLDKSFVLNEARYQPQNYHETLSSAIEDAINMAESLGYEVNKDDIFSNFGTGGVGYGESKRGSIEIYKDGKPQRKMLQIIIYRLDSGKYELVTYIN